MLRFHFGSLAVALLALSIAGNLPAENNRDSSQLTIDRIYKSKEFEAKGFDGKWLHGEAAYTTIEPSDDSGSGKGIVRYEAASGQRSILVESARLVPPGESKPLAIDGYSVSNDQNLVLIYTHSKRVWRHRTRGDYWLLDRTSRQLRKIGVDAPPSTLMFAKLSPDGQSVAYVRDRQLYLEDLRDHSVRQLTESSRDTLIHGTTDWVYEEELGLRDGFRWSPDSRWIALWQIDTEGVANFPLINQTDSLYPTVQWFPYPKVGQRNPSARVGLIDCTSGETRWIDLPGDPREHYIPRMEFLPQQDEDHDPRLLIQQLNRLQNTNRLFLADARSGTVTKVMTESDQAWVDVHDELRWIDEGKRFTWISDRDGWRHLYLASLDGSEPTLVTPGEFDVVELLDVDEREQVLYFIASPDSATERYLYRVSFDGKEMTRITPAVFPGVHSYRISPDHRWAFDTHSSANRPPITNLVSLDDHRVVRELESNEALAKKLKQLDRSDTEFFRVGIGDGVELDGWCIRPTQLDPQKKYPLLIYVYGEPAGSTVVNRWGGTSYLWHLMLAQQGYVVMSFDNRGTKAPRGRAWRKSVYKKIGVLPPQDQAAALESVLASRPYLDADRVGIWGWSGGGSSSLHAIFKYPDLYASAIAVAPVPNQRYYDTIYQERYMALPEMNEAGFREGSAINFAKNLQGNLLLIHGTGDDNCHYQTTEMLMDELIAHDKTFSLMVYPNRTHSIRERANTTPHLRKTMTEFLLRVLPPDTREPE